jgi:hypothetical protein
MIEILQGLLGFDDQPNLSIGPVVILTISLTFNPVGISYFFNTITFQGRDFRVSAFFCSALISHSRDSSDL